MGLLSWMVEYHIKKDNEGNDVFYPHGLLGNGYVLSNEDIRKKVRSFSKKFYVIGFFIILGVQPIAGWKFSLLFIIPLLGVYYYYFYAHIKKLEVSKLGPTLPDRLKIYALSSNIFMLIFNFIVSIGFIYLAIFLIISDQYNEPGLILMYLTSIIFFGSGGFFFGWMIYLKWVNKRRRSE